MKHEAHSTEQFSYVDHCHSFLPILDVALTDPFTPIQKFPTLFSTVLAIASRFYRRHNTTHTLDPQLPLALAEIAESLLAKSILRKQHALADVQAILLLAAWGLRPGGKGPDAWVLTGHATRVARRLGVHRVVAHAITGSMGPQDRSESGVDGHDAAVSRQWRLW